MNTNERFGQIEAMLADLLRRMDRQAEQMDRQSGQIDSIIGILRISDERQTRAEERQDAMLTEMQHGFAESGRRFDEQNEHIKEQGKHVETLLNTQMRMLELMSRQANKTDELAERIPTIAAYEGRVRRLEDAVFNKAS